MQRLEQEVNHCKKEVEDQREKLAQAMKQSVDLESLSTKIFGQFLNFVSKKVQDVSGRPCYLPKSKMSRS